MPRRSAGGITAARLHASALLASIVLAPAVAPAQPIPPAPADPEIAARAAAAAAESAGLPPLPGGPPVPGLVAGGGQGGQQQAVFVPAGPPPVVQHLSPDRPLAARDARNLSMATRHRAQACTPSRDADGTLRFRTGGCEVTVVCAPLRVCNVALEPGEVIMQATDIGDAARWITGVRASRAGDGQTTYNIAVKPTDAGLDTTLLFHTDRRTVNLRLVSRRDRYMPLVALEDGIGRNRAEWQQAVAHGRSSAQRQSSPCDAAPVVPPAAFKVGASGWFASDPPWTPVQVYAVATDAGQATCIEFPADIGATDAPVFVPYDARGQQRTLNVRRLSARRWLVDGAVSRAALVAPDHTKVMIERRR